MRILLIFSLVFLLFYCKKTTTSMEKYSYTWPLMADSMNFALLVVEGETYKLESGHFAHYELCNNCGKDSLPFDITVLGAMNFDLFTIKYSLTSDTLFIALAYLDNSHSHAIVYPEIFLPPDTFKVTNNIVQKPDSIEYFGYFTGMDKTTLKLKTDSVWTAINSLDIVNDFGQKDFQIGFFRFPESLYMNDAKWVVFLCR